MKIIHGVWAKAAAEGDIILGPRVSTMVNYKKLLKAIRKESCDLSLVLSNDPAPNTAKYKYLYQFVRRKTGLKVEDSYEVSLEDSVVNDEPPTQS